MTIGDNLIAGATAHPDATSAIWAGIRFHTCHLAQPLLRQQGLSKNDAFTPKLQQDGLADIALGPIAGSLSFKGEIQPPRFYETLRVLGRGFPSA